MALSNSKRLFYFLVVFCPLAFGTVEPWSYAFMQTGVSLAAIFLIFHIHRNSKEIYSVPGIIPLGIFLLYILLQVIPLPPQLVSIVSPHTYQIHNISQELTDTNGWMTISVYPKATLSEFFRYGTYVLFYALTVQLLSDKSTLKTIVFTVTIFGAILSFSSILQHYLTNDMALWIRKVPTDANVFGPYINRNHYAGLMEMLFPVTLSLFFFYRPRIGNTSLIKGIAEIFSQEKANIHILIGCASLLIAVSIFLTLSRSGIVFTCISLLLFIVLMLKRNISRGNTVLVISIVLAVFLSISWFGWDQILGRFEQLKFTENDFVSGRKVYWTDSSGIIKDFKITGTGFGSFRNIYPSYQTPTSSIKLLTHAHNDYIELMVEGGVIGTLTIIAFFLSFLSSTYKMFNTRRDGFSIYLYTGSVTGLFAILLHSLTDFNFHIGANGLWFAFICGLAVASAYTNIQRQSDLPTRLETVPGQAKRRALSALIVMFSLLNTAYSISHLMGTVYYSHIKDVRMSVNSPNELLNNVKKVANLASVFDPLDSKYPFTQGLTTWYQKDRAQTLHFFSKALRLDPLNSSYFESVGFFMSGHGSKNKAHLSFESATRYDISKSRAWLNYGAWLLVNDEKQKGIEYLKKALFLDERQIDKILTSMAIAGLSFEEMELAIPELPASAIAFAKFLDNTGQRKKADQRYIEALELAENTFPVTQHYFRQIYYHFLRRKNLNMAMTIVQRGESALPDDPWFKTTLGNIYMRQGVEYKAKEKYEEALLVDPTYKPALKRLQNLSP